MKWIVRIGGLFLMLLVSALLAVGGLSRVNGFMNFEEPTDPKPWFMAAAGVFVATAALAAAWVFVPDDDTPPVS